MFFFPIVYCPTYPWVIELKGRYRWLPSSSALDPLQGLSVFQIWRECRPRFGDPNLAKIVLLKLEFFSRLGRLKMLVTKNHFVREVGCFPISCHICIMLKYGTEWQISVSDIPEHNLSALP